MITAGQADDSVLPALRVALLPDSQAGGAVAAADTPLAAAGAASVGTALTGAASLPTAAATALPGFAPLVARAAMPPICLPVDALPATGLLPLGAVTRACPVTALLGATLVVLAAAPAPGEAALGRHRCPGGGSGELDEGDAEQRAQGGAASRQGGQTARERVETIGAHRTSPF